MIELRNSSAQIIPAGGTVALDTVIRKCGCGESYYQGLNFVRLTTSGLYKIEFSGNITGTTAGTGVQLAIALEGVGLPEAVMEYTPATANAFGNVSTGTTVANCNIDVNKISVINTGTEPVTLSANFNLRIFRQG